MCCGACCVWPTRDFRPHLSYDGAVPKETQTSGSSPAPRSLQVAERTRFVGRAEELSSIPQLWDRPSRVTVVGPGGVGKTRLARELGRGAEFPGGVWFCELSEARSLSELTAALTRSLELSVETDVGAWLASRGRALLLLDNGEQLERAARDALGAWLAAAPRLTALATSREPLGLPGERVFELGPLTPADAAALFVDRGQAWDQRIAEPAAREQIAKVVGLIDRLPLAIELAAARLDVLSVGELHQRLARTLDVVGPAVPGTPGRHSSLRALLEWSDEALTPDERRLLQVLSAFRGGVSLPVVTGLLGSEGHALAGLGALRRKSLLIAGEGRYRLYEVVRSFYQAQLTPEQRAQVERRHAEVMIALARELNGQVDRRGENDALEQLAVEQENLLAIDDRFHAREPALAAEALLALHPVLLTRGPLEAQLARLDRALAGLPGDDPEFPALQLARGEVRRLRGQLDGALEDFEGVLSRREVRSDAKVASEALRRWAMLEGARGRPLEALQRIRRALKLARSVGDPLLEAKGLGALGAAQQSLGRLHRAISAHSRALALLRRVGSQRLIGMELSYLAVATHRLGHVADAEGLHRQALAIHRELRHRRFEAVELTHLGYLAHELGDFEQARASYRAGLELFADVGDRLLQGVVLTFLGRLELEAKTPEARPLLEQALAIHRESNHARLEATTLVLLAHLRRDEGELPGAVELYRRALERSQSVEVGFETLTEAWLEEAKRAQGASRPELFEAAVARARRHENPAYAIAARVLAGEPPGVSELRAAAARSSEVRRALMLTRIALPTADVTRLVISRDGGWFTKDDGEPVELSRRRAVRLMLLELTRARLNRPGEALGWETLLAASWPGERPVNDSGLKRVYTAIWTLRKLGLEGVLQTRGDGYLLDTAAVVRWGDG